MVTLAVSAVSSTLSAALIAVLVAAEAAAAVAVVAATEEAVLTIQHLHSQNNLRTFYDLYFG